MSVRTTGLDLRAEVWQAARIAAGEQVPDASEEARALAARAVADADREWMEDLAEHQRGQHVPSGRKGPRVSDYGTCGRQVWYREHPPADYTPEPIDERRATLGQIIHQAAETARAVRYPWRVYEQPLDIPGLDRPGKFDEYDPVLGEVTDGKTAGRAKWVSYGEGPPAAAVGQVNIYAYVLDQMGLPVRTVRIIAINRDTGREESFRTDYDPSIGRAALDELVGLATLLDLGIAPEREGTGPGSFPCSWCPAWRHCWNVEAADAAGRSPESYTILGATLEDPIVEWAARELHRTQAALRDAEKARDAARALLGGVPLGTYGGMEVRQGSMTRVDYKSAFMRLLDLYALPDEHRPPVERVSEPPKNISRWLEAKPVRAAKTRKGKAPEVAS